MPAAVEWLDHTGIVGLQQFTDTGYPTDAAAIVLIDIDGTAEQVERDTEIVEEVLRRNAVEVRRADDDDGPRQAVVRTPSRPRHGGPQRERILHRRCHRSPQPLP